MELLMKLILTLLTFFSTSLLAAQKADLVVVSKKEETLTLYKNQKVLGVYPVVFGTNPVGHKQQEGDRKTPEGRYVLDYKKPNSSFYKAIHISYPNAQDIANAKKRGVSPGGAIMVHGQPNGFEWAEDITQLRNWTHGCIALKNKDLDAVWGAVDAGTPIEILP